MSQQDNPQSSTLQRPATDNPEEWKTYWKSQGQHWRTEPEIEIERQEKLKARLAIVPNVKKGIYPFKGMALYRADIEWLLWMHQNGHEPVDWNNESQQDREGLDLRGADLRYQNLSNLPLSRLRGGLSLSQWFTANAEQRKMAAILMEGANLCGAYLEKTDLSGSQMKGIQLREAQLKGARLHEAQLEGADLREAQLEETDLREAHLKRADLREAQLKRADLSEAQLEKAYLSNAQIEATSLIGAQLEAASLIGAQLKGANLYRAQLKGANLYRAQLKGADFSEAQLEGVNFSRTRLESVNFSKAQLEGVNFSKAQLESINFEDAKLNDRNCVGPQLADAQWGNTNLAIVDWSQVKKLGDEHQARMKKDSSGEKKDKSTSLNEYKAAVRANRQLAVVLRNQGLNEEADHFAYRAQLLQQVVWRRQRRILKYILSWFLYLIAGYGYRPLRSLIIYLLIIGSFAIGYYEVTHILHAQPYPLAWHEALILSVSSFHGRGFFQPVQSLGDPVAILASIEAVCGLLIEISFIATFTQRFFGK